MGETPLKISDAPDLGPFLKSLVEEGRAVVRAGPLADDSLGASAALEQLDKLAREQLGLETPAFSMDAALWAARLTYHLCQFAVCRDIEEARIKEICNLPCPGTRGPEVDWSVDLTLRHLPNIHQLSHQLSNADPLVQRVREIAVTWPLSSVGIPKLSGFKLDPFIEHPALLRLYADRIFAAGDESRLGDERVDQLLQADLGMHHQLAPAMATKLFPQPA